MLTLWCNPMFGGVGIAHHYCMFPCSLCWFVRRRPVACVPFSLDWLFLLAVAVFSSSYIWTIHKHAQMMTRWMVFTV